MTASRIIVAERQAARDHALRELLFWCLAAQADGVPLPEDLDRAIGKAEGLVDLSDLMEHPPQCKA